MATNLIYGIHDRPPFSKLVLFAFQQLLAIIAATIAVPAIVGNGMSASAALFGAGVGTLVYQLFTKFRSPVFLGSSFAFIDSMSAAFAGATSMSLGYLGLLVGALFGGLVYVILAVMVKLAGVSWINKLMPPVVIGPTVSLIGLSLASSAVKDVFSYAHQNSGGSFIMTDKVWFAFLCALVTLTVVILCSAYGKKMTRLTPFIIGLVVGYALALVLTVVGYTAHVDAMKVIDFTPFTDLAADGVELKTFLSVPDFSFIRAIDGIKDFEWSYLATIAVAYVPVAFVVFAEHIAEHKELSTVIEQDLLEDPGLHRTLLGDGVGSIAGAFFGGCPNTTYGESIGCMAITHNASVATISATAVLSILISFFSPVVALLDSIPDCIMGGVCITLYGYIAVSGMKMMQKVHLSDSANLFTVAVILITGVGGMSIAIGEVVITSIACALILGILVNTLLTKRKK